MSAGFHEEVDALRGWLATGRGVDEYARWWSEDGVVARLEGFLARVPPRDWSEDEVTDLLYVLAHATTADVAQLFTRSEPAALAIARHSLARGGLAGDDIAEQLQYCSGHRDEAEALLLAFARDAHERTRRLALLSLAALQSPAVPALAVAAWETGDAYARMGALAALRAIGSDLFPRYLSLAEQDGRESLAGLARKYAGESQGS